MASGKNSPRLGRNFLPFCAGIACGIGISVLLFLVFAIFGQVWFKSGQNNELDLLPIEQNKASLSKPGRCDIYICNCLGLLCLCIIWLELTTLFVV